jgi:hypothetical protein
MSAKAFDPRCKAIAKSGKRCGAAAMEGGLCFFHTNPDKASELGRIGGRKNRHFRSEPADPLPTLDSAVAVRQTVARLVEDVYAGKVHPRTASGLASLLNLQLRAIETSDLERRLEHLEKRLADAGSEGNSDSHVHEPDPDLHESAGPFVAEDEDYDGEGQER